MVEFAEICRSYGVTEVVAVGTAALRVAQNSIDFVNRVKERTGFDLQVIFSAPPEKTMDAVSFADRIIVAYKEDLSSYTRSFTSGELKNENTI